MKAVVVYYKPVCPFCLQAMRVLRNHGATPTLIDITNDPQRRAEMISKTKRQTVPQIFIGNTHVGGCDDLLAVEKSGELDKLLK